MISQDLTVSVSVLTAIFSGGLGLAGTSLDVVGAKDNGGGGRLYILPVAQPTVLKR